VDSLTGELSEHQAHFRENRVLAAELCDNLTTAQFNWRPQPGRWSIAECLVHLNISGRLFGQAIALAMNDARRAGLVGTGPFRYGPLSRWFLGFVDPDSKKRYKTPSKFAPESSERFEVERVLEEFRAAGIRWEQCLRDANGLDLARVKVRSPAVPLLRFQLGALFAIQSAHEKRHLRQAERVKTTVGFPS
jgi:DinB family protein